MCVCLYTYTAFTLDVLGNTIIIVAHILNTKLLQAIRDYNAKISQNIYIVLPLLSTNEGGRVINQVIFCRFRQL